MSNVKSKFIAHSRKKTSNALTSSLGARLCNSLPADIAVFDTLPQFRRGNLKHFLFTQSYPSILL